MNCMLFAAIRYASIAVICVSSYDFFYDHFSNSTCHHWYIVPESLKVVQAMVAQAIMAWRVYVVSRRKPVVKWSIIGFYIVVCAGEWVTNLFHRRIVLGIQGNCQSLNIAQIPTAWLFYLIASFYDLVTLILVVLYLNGVHAKSYLMSRLKRILIYQGFVYFLAILAGNLINMVIYVSKTNQFQTAGVPISYTLTWIFAQKLLIHLHELALSEKISEDDHGMRTVTINITQSSDVDVLAEEISHAVQTSFEAGEDSFDVDVRIRAHRRTISADHSQLSDISKDV